jgi:replication fork clamp-binding protein CrfC
MEKIQFEIPCDFDVEAFKKATEKKSRRELRFERKMYKDSLRHNEKMYKLETKRLEDSLIFQKKLNRELTKRLRSDNKKDTKVSKHENKSSPFLRFVGRMWWLFIIFGIAIGVYIKRFLPF